mmetsp:Transcript_16858/g.37939  ORF Transcript_16858/g.37939 Transcript_16858/m.37939 type:complete len:262 (-) Transcript_16858:410-1195(-)
MKLETVKYLVMKICTTHERDMSSFFSLGPHSPPSFSVSDLTLHRLDHPHDPGRLPPSLDLLPQRDRNLPESPVHHVALSQLILIELRSQSGGGTRGGHVRGMPHVPGRKRKHRLQTLLVAPCQRLPQPATAGQLLQDRGDGPRVLGLESAVQGVPVAELLEGAVEGGQPSTLASSAVFGQDGAGVNFVGGLTVAHEEGVGAWRGGSFSFLLFVFEQAAHRVQAGGGGYDDRGRHFSQRNSDGSHWRIVSFLGRQGVEWFHL